MSAASPENILLYLPEEQERAVTDLFARLEAQGLPKQNQRPHITITFAPRMDPRVVEHASELLPPLLPATFRRTGTVIFGTKSKQTIAWLLETSPELEAVARELSTLNPEGRGERWIPHLTMGLRIPRTEVPTYLDALDRASRVAARTAESVSAAHALREFTVCQAAYWKPGEQILRVF